MDMIQLFDKVLHHDGYILQKSSGSNRPHKVVSAIRASKACPATSVIWLLLRSLMCLISVIVSGTGRHIYTLS